MEADALHNAITKLYAAPIADFIRARDTLAKELRSAGDRDASSVVKSLRKPSRAAWALNRVAHEQPERLAALEHAITELSDAHAGNADVRSAMAALRAAVRKYAVEAEAECRRVGFSLDIGDLSNAILAVLGQPRSYADFRSGRLTELPEPGGLDFLTSLPARPHLEVASSAAPPLPADPAEAAAASEQSRLAAEALQAAQSAAAAAAAALVQADSDVAAAQAQLRTAESEMQAALQRREFARRTKEAANAELRTAEAASHAADRRLNSIISN